MSDSPETWIDIQISKILDMWEESSKDDLTRMLMRALHYHIVPAIYSVSRKQLLLDALHFNKKIKLNRFNSLSRIALHLIHIFSWNIKWLFFPLFVQRSSEIIICSLNTERIVSKNYLMNIHHYAKENNAVVVQYGTFTSFYKLFSLDIFSCPSYLIRFKKYKKQGSQDRKLIFSTLADICKKKLDLQNVDFQNQQKYLILYQKLFFEFSNFVTQLARKKKICCLIQDGGYTSTKILYSYSASQMNIPIVTLDHSIIIYDHLYKNDISDYYFCWGEYSKNRMQNLSLVKPKIYIISRPDVNLDFEKRQGERKYAVYFLPAFHNPMLQSANRSLSYSILMIRRIEQILSELFPSLSLLVKPHPVDDPRHYKSLGLNLYSKQLKIIIPSIGFLFSEDSTITLELLKYNIPLVYLLDKSEEDIYNFNKFNLKHMISNYANIQKTMENYFFQGSQYRDKKRMFKYYFGENVGNEFGLYHKMKQVF